MPLIAGVFLLPWLCFLVGMSIINGTWPVLLYMLAGIWGFITVGCTVSGGIGGFLFGLALPFIILYFVVGILIESLD